MASSEAFRTIPSGSKVEPTPFDISVPQDRIQLLQSLVKHAYVAPKTYETSGKAPQFGILHEWLQSAKHEWETTFDWREQEKRFNTFPQYKMPIGDAEIHFMALFSEKPDAVPIAFLHGWPGSFIEFLGVFKLLTERYTPSTLPYHIVAPSLPGWGFSSKPPVDREFDTNDAADLISKLMVTLGFGGGYMVQGGDIGSYISRRLASSYPECKAIHLNFSIMPEGEPKGVDKSKVTAEEKAGLERANEFYQTGAAYSREHATKPGTIGLVLSSNPLAYLAWIGEKFLAWSDEPHPSMTEILTTASLYFLTDTIATSIYTYRHPKGHAWDDWRVPRGKAFGYSWFPKELAAMPVEWVDKTAEDGLQWFRRHNEGGHFAALERPELLLGDVEDFVKATWKK